jgi:hypothetical protein
MCQHEKTLHLSPAFSSNGDMTQQMMMVHALGWTIDPDVPNQYGATLEVWRQKPGKRAERLGSHSVWTDDHGATMVTDPSESVSKCVAITPYRT